MPSLVEPGEVLPYEDLRDFIQIVDQMGELRRVDGVDQYLEIGALSSINRPEPKSCRGQLGTHSLKYLGPTPVPGYISPGGHGLLHPDHRVKPGKPWPVGICVGADPRLFLAGTNYQSEGICEYDYMGALQG